MNEIKNTPTVAILGCGWLGFALAVNLARSGWQVKGSTTSAGKLDRLQSSGIIPYLLKAGTEGLEPGHSEFFDADVLIINIPPGFRYGAEPAAYAKTMRHVRKSVDATKVSHLIFISSTGVYPDINGIVTEETPPDASSDRSMGIFEAEEVIRQVEGVRTTIMRCAGLMGYDRIAGKYFAGKRIDSGELPVNHVHRDDVIKAIKLILENDYGSEVFNIVAPLHPSREIVYKKSALAAGYELPVFEEKKLLDFKIVSGQKFELIAGFTYKYDDPANFPYTDEPDFRQ